MERFSFGPEVAFVPRGDLLEDVNLAPLTRPMGEGFAYQAAVFRFGPGGRIVRHPATIPQILAVLDGSGETSGADGVPTQIAAGDAVFWQAGEAHEVTSAAGLTALIIEAEQLEPFRREVPT